MAPTASALGSVVNAKPESAGWLPISSIYVASSPANSLAPNESVQCICSLDWMSWYNVAYLCAPTTSKQQVWPSMCGPTIATSQWQTSIQVPTATPLAHNCPPTLPCHGQEMRGRMYKALTATSPDQDCPPMLPCHALETRGWAKLQSKQYFQMAPDFFDFWNTKIFDTWVEYHY